MHRRKTFTKHHYTFVDPQKGDVWVVKKRNRSLYTILYYDDELKTVKYAYDNKDFDGLGDFVSYRKFSCSYDILMKTLHENCVVKQIGIRYEYEFKDRYSVLNISTSHEFPKLYDFVRGYDSNLKEYAGVLVASNKITCYDGSTVSVKFLEKMSDSDCNCDEYKSRLQKAQMFVKNKSLESLNTAKSSSNTEYKLGDIYKKGSMIYICLGDNRKINFSFNPTEKFDRLGYKLKFELPEPYTSGGTLWLKIKLSDSYALSNAIGKIISGEKVDLDDRSIYVLLVGHRLKFEFESTIMSYSITNIKSLVYDVKPSTLGSKIYHIDGLDGRYWLKKTMRFNTYRHSETYKALANMLSMSIY